MWKAALIALWLPGTALAQGLPQPLSDTVSDLDGLIPDATEARLVQVLSAARAETGVHVVLVAMDRRAAHGGAGQSIEAYGLALFNAWGVGDRNRNDGVMILVTPGDREMRIQLGSGFAPEWNGVAQGVIDGSFLPAFRDNRTVAGIETGTAAVIEQIARPFAAGQPAPKGGGDGSGMVFWLIAGPFIAVLGIFVGVGFLFSDWRVRFQACPSCGQKTLSRSRVVTQSPTRHSTGSGWMTTRCGSCTYVVEKSYVISQLSEPSSSDSGGGFGGGSSSGGGASGKW